MIVNDSILDDLPCIVACDYRYWATYMCENITFSLKASPIHTRAHAERVLLYALVMAHRMKDILPAHAATMLAHAAVFHDTCRLDDGLDVGHGGRAAAHYKEFAATHAQVSYYEEAKYTIAYHDCDDNIGVDVINNHFGPQSQVPILIYKIFKDADALDRFRLGADGLDVSYLRTRAAMELIGFARNLVAVTT